MTCKNKIIAATIAVAMSSCTPSYDPAKNTETVNLTDKLVYQDSSTFIYLCDHEWQGIVLSETNPQDILFGTSYHVPTKETAKILHTLTMDVGSQRYLCVDISGAYYTFCFNNQGSITKAGAKTKYALRPVRVVAVPKDTIINL